MERNSGCGSASVWRVRMAARSSPWRKASTAYAVRRPSAIAWTTVAAPVRTSPVPKMPGRPVSKVTGSTLRRLLLRRLRPLVAGADPGEVRPLADGEEDAVALDDELGPGCRLGAATAGRVGRAELHPDELDAGDLPGGLVDDDAGRAGLEDRGDALLDRLVDLARGRHVLHVATVDEGHLGGPLADRGADAVHRGEAATDRHDARAGVARIGQAEGGDLEVLQAVDDAVRILVRDPQHVRVVAPDGDHDRVEALVLEVVEAEVAPERLAADEAPAEAGDALVLGVEDAVLRQAILGDAVAEHPAGGLVALEDRDVMARDQEVVGGRRAGRPGADHRHPLARRRLQLEGDRRVDVLLEHLPQDLVAGVAMAVADRDRLVDLVAAAVLLAGRRADAAEDRGEGDRPLEDPDGLAELGLRVRLQEARDVDVAGALVLAGRKAVGIVVGEDQLEVRPPDPPDLLGLGPDDHPGLGRARARDRRMLLALHLHDAHPAGAEARQLGLVAEGRDLDAVVAADLQDRLALAALDEPSVDLQPDAGRRLRALRRLGPEEALGEAVDDRLGAGRRDDVGGARDQVGHRAVVAYLPVAAAGSRIGLQTPAGQTPRRMWSSISGPKYRIEVRSGPGASRS